MQKVAAMHERENPYYKKNFIEIAQVESMGMLEYLFQLADRFKEMYEAHDPRLGEVLKTFCIAIMFYQPSTRTYGSFSIAAKLLGAHTVEVQDMNSYSSTTKGEKLPDSAMTAAQAWLAHLIVQRHPEDKSSHIIADKLTQMGNETLVVNAGSGKLEHPTQALLDAYTIFNRLGKFDNLNVVMVGDMKFGRTVKSLATLLATVGTGNRITFIAPKGLEMPPEFIASLNEKVEIVQTDSLENLGAADVVYWTRLQKEWYEEHKLMELYDQIKDNFILTPEIAAQFSENTVIMHPLPRVNEIDERVDTDPRAVYLTEQMRSGPFIRMALLAAMLRENPFLVLQNLSSDE